MSFTIYPLENDKANAVNRVSLFFIPYILLEVPSNAVLKRFKRPSVYLGILVVSWGIVMTLTGVVKNFAGLVVTRIFLGITEAGFFPGAVYLITRYVMIAASMKVGKNQTNGISDGMLSVKYKHVLLSSTVPVHCPAPSRVS